MTVKVEAKEPISLGVGQRTGIFFIIAVAVLVVAAVAAFLVFTPLPGLASSSSDASRSVQADSARWEAMAAYYAAQAQVEPRALQADTARWEAMAEYYGAQAQVEPRVMSAYDANNTARELRNPALAAILSAQAPAESAYVAFLNARALRDAAPAVHTGGLKAIGSPALDVSDRGCTYDNGSRVFVCRS